MPEIERVVQEIEPEQTEQAKKPVKPEVHRKTRTERVQEEIGYIKACIERDEVIIIRDKPEELQARERDISQREADLETKEQELEDRGIKQDEDADEQLTALKQELEDKLSSTRAGKDFLKCMKVTVELFQFTLNAFETVKIEGEHANRLLEAVGGHSDIVKEQQKTFGKLTDNLIDYQQRLQALMDSRSVSSEDYDKDEDAGKSVKEILAGIQSEGEGEGEGEGENGGEYEDD